MTNEITSFESDLALLEYYQAIGVNLSIQELPRNRFKKASEKKTSNSKITDNIVSLIAGDNSSIDADPSEATRLAKSAKNLQELEKFLNDFDGCALKKRATQVVFSDGNPKADIMIIGGAPGRDEDIEGTAFVGRSGPLLDKMLNAIELDRTKVYLANIVAWRPPGDRNPTASEVASCLPFLYRQIELVAPKIIVTLGAPTAHTLFNNNMPITKMRGNWCEFELNDLKIKALPTFHPDFLLRQPAQKAYAWQDMLKLKAAIIELAKNA